MNHRSHWHWLISLLMIVSGLSMNADGQVLVGSGVDDTQTHAWAAYTNAQDEIVLVHIPPRDADPGSSIPFEPALPGELHALRMLSKFPDALTGIGERVYLVFPETYSQGRRVRRVLSGRVIQSPVGSVWNFTPRGRLDAEPAIRIQGQLVSLASTDQAVWALLRTGEKDTLLKMGDTQWEPVDLPDLDSSPPSTGRWVIAAAGSRLLAINFSKTNPDGTSTLTSYGINDEQTAWSAMDWATVSAQPDSVEILSSTHGLILIERDAQGKVQLRTWSRAGIFTIASGLDLPAGIRFSVLGSANRLVGVVKVQQETDSQPDTESNNTSTVRVYEIDLSDGSVIYSGDPVVSTPVGEAEMRFLMGMMILIMVGVLVVVIMPDKSDAMGIPDGYQLVDPGRRLLATMIDVFLVALMIGYIFDVRVAEILTLSVIARSESAWLAIPVMQISGVVAMSLMEWLLGASPGKFFVGVRVVKAQSGAMHRIGLRSAIVRNVIKWILPPVAALALVDPEMLHRGDRATRTIVASPIETPSQDEDQDTEH